MLPARPISRNQLGNLLFEVLRLGRLQGRSAHDNPRLQPGSRRGQRFGERTISRIGASSTGTIRETSMSMVGEFRVVVIDGDRCISVFLVDEVLGESAVLLAAAVERRRPGPAKDDLGDIFSRVFLRGGLLDGSARQRDASALGSFQLGYLPARSAAEDLFASTKQFDFRIRRRHRRPFRRNGIT